MKLRNGFVSNSSTSSFLIYGVCFESSDDLYDALKLDEEPEGGVWDIIYELEDELGLAVELPYEGDYGVYIGESWSSVKDDETGAEFKARIEKKLKEKFGDDIKFGTYAEAWRDG